MRSTTILDLKASTEVVVVRLVTDTLYFSEVPMLQNLQESLLFIHMFVFS